MEQSSNVAINPQFGMFGLTGGAHDAIHSRYPDHHQHTGQLQGVLLSFPKEEQAQASAL
jgi:hypothetical protein